MDELQELHGELDVTQAPAAELELALGQLGRHVLLHAPAHLLHVLDEVLPLRGGPHDVVGHLDVLAPQFGVARDRARLEQGLELPGARPLLVVGRVPVERPYEGAGLALGT